ncbi:cytochrome P450 [Umezawaea sp. Da 62-37]|uniref:cytochrome P450 family protein n=1 Tax=Umezawaea sp. Da 62-37 TaxID=3075927 RepID=UPI0028F6F8A9|nr:cytochrome P450 [Umezawaea sp. Da 62-37]WNV84550.1 cytochrome P450 [Umezawaea sp. Da 62-37]
MSEGRCPVLDSSGSGIHELATKVRDQGPAVKVELPGGVHAWWVTRYDVAKRLLGERDVTKSAHEHWPAFREGAIPPGWQLISWVAMDNVSTSHGADHHRLRKLIGKAFTARRVEQLRPRVTELVNGLLDDIAAAPDGVVDLRAMFCYPLPAQLMAGLVGMTEEQRRQTAIAMNRMADVDVTPEQAEGVLAGWRAAIVALIADKRANPAEDIASALIAARDDEDGAKLSDQELIDTTFAILGAGSDTTINFLDNAITALLTHPEQLELVRSGGASWNDVIEETLRVEAPLASLPLRFAVRDVELDGLTIKQGEPILINYAALGRDPELHGGTASDFDITRPDKEHISFGYGPHYCLGSGIARLVASIGLPALFERFPDLSLAVDEDGLQPLPTFIMNAHTTLPVRLTAPLPAGS